MERWREWLEEMGGMLRERRGSQEMDETNLWE